MNAVLWILQSLLALHTFAGAMWKLFNSEQTVPSLKPLPHEVWLGLICLEVLCGVGLLLPAFSKRLSIAVPIAAAGIAAEMLLFSALHAYSGNTDRGELIYWLAVTVVCAFIAYGRIALKPIATAARPGREQGTMVRASAPSSE